MSDHRQESSLRPDAVGLLGLVSESLGGTSPEQSAVLFGGTVAVFVGAFAPAAFVLGSIAAFGLGLIFARLARRSASAGGTYTALRKALGRRSAYAFGFASLILLVLLVPVGIVSAATVLEEFFSTVAPHVHALSSTWVLWAAVICAVIFPLAYFGVRPSIAVLIAFSAVGMISLAGLGAVILAKNGAHGLPWPTLAPWKFRGVGASDLFLVLGVVISAFGGFEDPIYLGEEAREPRRTIPVAILGVLLGMIIFYVFIAFSFVAGYGTGAKGVAALESDGVFSVLTLSTHYLSAGFGDFLLLVVALAATTSALAVLTVATRLIFAWARDGLLPAPLSLAHHRHQTPHIAVAAVLTVTVMGFIAALVWQGSTISGGTTFFVWGFLVVGVVSLFTYGMVSVSGVVDGYRNGLGLIGTWLPTVLSLPILGAGMYSQFHPLPKGDFRSAPFAGAGVVVLAAALAARRRLRLARDIGATPPKPGAIPEAAGNAE